jgi:hypothetical protein
MAGNYNYTTKMDRNQFYDEYATLSSWAGRNRAYFPSFKDSHLFSSPGYRQVMVDGKFAGGLQKGFHDDFNNAYSRYTNLFDSRVAAQEAAQKQIDNQVATANRLRGQQSQRMEQLDSQQKAKATQLAADQAANVKSMAAAQAQKVGAIRSSGQAVSSSLSILADKEPTAPTAVKTNSRARKKGAASTAAQVARGSSRNRGFNLSI